MKNKFSRRVLARVIATKLIAEPSRADYWIKLLAAYLIDQHREKEADLLLNDLAHELYVQNGQLMVEVTSARPLSEAIRTQLKQLLTSRTDASRVELVEAVDPELIGGLIARTPDAVLDASVRGTLNQLATIK
jgi:F-type H+-transporting ATPase subunit delta